MESDDIRFKISAARRMLYREGCDSQTAGHVSVRSEGEEAMYVTPFSYFDETVPAHVIKTTLDLQLLEGDWVPSPAISFHAAIYRARPDVNSVIHTHSRHVCAVGTTKRTIGMYHVSSALFYRDQGYCGAEPEDNAIVESLGKDKHVSLMQNHGAVVVGDSLENTTIKAMMLEKAARYHIDAEAVDGEPMNDEVSAKMRNAHEEYFLPQMWKAHLRRLRVSDPDLYSN
ncbi:MAG TPA: class II aldolase/adducin family protein [Candidatus Dormibacteraeota bacterium]|jgi:L-fuculose-phosphate aldolase|nr:class II aldolase/adducin family protein [Candidatus Dormibacteraeota bacterium]